MTVSLSTTTSNRQNLSTFRNEIDDLKSTSEKNIASMNKDEREDFKTRQTQIVNNCSQTANFFIEAIKKDDDSKDEALEDVKMSADTTLADFKSLIADEEIAMLNDDNKEEQNEQKQSDIENNGQIKFGQFANRAQGIINSYVNNFVKTESDNKTEDTKDSKNFTSIQSIRNELSSLLEVGEVKSKDELNDEKNEYAEIVDKYAKKALKTLFAKSQTV